MEIEVRVYTKELVQDVLILRLAFGKKKIFGVGKLMKSTLILSKEF